MKRVLLVIAALLSLTVLLAACKKRYIIYENIRNLFGKAHVSKDYLLLGRFAPYLERACIRPLTPWVSSVPRMMW